MPEHHLSSLVVHAKPEQLDAVSERLIAEGCEIHGVNPEGKLVIVFETDEGRELSETITRIQLLPGVLAATLVYHHVEPSDPETETVQ